MENFFFYVPIAIHTSRVAFLHMLFSSIPRSCIPRGSPLRDREYEYLGFDDRSATGSWLLPPVPPAFCFPSHWLGAPTRHLHAHLLSVPRRCISLWNCFSGTANTSILDLTIAALPGLAFASRPARFLFPTALARRAYIWHLPCVPFSLFPGDALFTNCIPGPRIRVYLLACRLQRFAAFSLQP